MKALSFLTAISLLLSFLTPVVAVAAAPAPATVAASPAVDVLPAWVSQPSERQLPATSSAALLPAWMGGPVSAGTAASNPAAVLPAWFEAATVSAPQASPANAPLRVVTSPAGLSVSGPTTVNVCDTITYTVVFTNNTTPITDVIVTSAIHTPYVPSPQSCGPYAMAANEVRTCTFVFDGGCAAVSGQNVVTLTQYGAEPIVRYTDLVVDPGAIIVRKEPAVQPAHLDDVVTWTVSVENTGYGDVTNVVLTDVLGSGMVYQSGLTTASIPRISVGEVLTFPVSARVDGCFDLTNVVTGTWGCDGQTCLTPQTASAAIDLEMRNPDLVYTLPTGFDVPFCAGSQTFTVPITNQGDGAAYSTTLTTDLSPFTVTPAPGVTYSGGAFHLPSIAPGAAYNLVFTLTLPADVCTMLNGGNFNFDIVYYDRCGNPYYELPQRAGWQLGDVPGEIGLTKTMPPEVYRGETITATIAVDVSGISGGVMITDTVPPGWTVLDAGGGVTFTVGSTTYITWEVGYSTTFDIVLLTPSDTMTGCAACGTQMMNTVAAWGTDCQDCARTASASASTYIQCDDGITSDKQVSAPLAPCSDDTFTYTNTYVFGNSFTVTPTWGGLFFTETLLHQTYVTGTAAVWVSNGPLSCAATFSESTAGGLLVITNISPTCAIDLPGATLQINYETRVGEPAACSDARWFDWSYLNLGVTGNDACAYDGVLQEGVFVETRAPQMQLTMNGLPATVSSCGAYTVTLTADRTTPDIAAYDAVIDLVTDTFAVVIVLGFDGALPVLTETNASGYHWYYGDAFATALTATVHLHVQLRCTNTAPFSATLRYDNRCADNDVYRERCPAGGALGNPLLAPCAPILTKFPEVIYATSDFVRWTLTVFNSGSGPAYNVTLTDTLGSGLRYVDSSILSTQGSVVGVTPVTSSRYVTWTLPVIQPKERVTILYDAEVISCNDLTNSFGGQQGCLGEACMQGCAAAAYVELPPTLLLNTNQVVSPIDTCYTRTITVTVRNAGMLSVYSVTVQETLPSGLNYVPGTTEVSTDTINWQPGPDPYSSGYQLRWDPTSGAPLDVWLARVRPHETVYIRFQTTASCPFTGGQIRVQTSYLDPCGISHDTLASSYVMQSRQPNLVFEKTGQNLDRAHPDPSLVYAEPGERVLWTITATNLTGASPATNVVVSDTLPGNAVYQSATPGYNLGAPPVGTLGGVITWTLGTLDPDQTVVLTVSTVISDPEGCLPLDTRNDAQLLWGCDDGCRVIMEAQAELRTRPVFDSPDLLTSIAPHTLNRCGGVLTVTLVNNGPPAYNVVLTDTLPGGFVYSDTVYASTLPSVTIDLGGTVVYTWAVLPTGVTTLTFSVRNARSAGNACALPTGPNSIVLQYDDDAEDCFDTGSYTATATPDLTFVGPALTITKTPPDQTLDVGDTVAWTLTVQNSGDGVAYNVVVTDVVGTNYVNVNAGFGSDGTTPVVAGNAITWTLVGPLAVGASWTATVTADIIDTGDNTNRAWVQGGCDTGCVTSSAYDEAHTTLLEEFGKQPEIQTGTIGSLVVFTVTARLSDWDALYENVILTDTLPVGLGYVASVLTYTYDQDQSGGTTVVSGTPSLAPGASASGPVVWRLGDLPGIVQINGVITAVIQNIVANQDGERLTNRFDMTYIDDGVLYAQTDATAVDILEPNLALDKRLATSTGTTIGLDGTTDLTYTLVITSDGDWPAYDVLITDAVPSGIYVTGIEGGDSRSLTTARPLTWTFAVIPANTVVVVTYTAHISGASPNVDVTNVATVTWTSTPDDPVGQERDGSDGPDGPLDDYADEDSETLTTAGLTFAKQVTPASTDVAPLRIGDVVTYTIVTMVPPGVYVPWPFQYDDLPAGVRYVVGTFDITSTMPFTAPDPLASAANYDSNPNGVQGSPHNANPYVGRSEANAVIETIEWWLDPLDNSVSATPGYVTVTFQAQLTGIGRNGVVQWTDPQAVTSLNNTARLYWNDNDSGSYDSTQPRQELVATVSSRVGQPLLHINKTYITPLGCGATLLEDTFNRASTTPPTGWTAAAGGWNINPTSGFARQSSSNTTNAILVRTGFVADAFSYSAMVRATDSASSRGLVFRYTANNYYLIRLRQGDTGNNVQLQEVTGGVFAELGTVAVTPVINRWYHVEARVETVSTGLRIRVYIDGQPYFDVIDATPRPAGSVGFYANACGSSLCQFDDVFVTRLDTTGCYVGANDLVTYTLTISNQGYMPAYDIVISDVLPSELTFVTSTLLSPPTPATSVFVNEPIPGDTGTLVWGVDVLSGTSPSTFNYGNQKTLQIQVVARVTDTVAANIRFSNQAFLPYYDSQPGDGPTGTPISSGTDADQRTYTDGSHSAGLQTVNAGIAKTIVFDPPPTATLGTLVMYTLIVPATPINATLYDVAVTDTLDSRLFIEDVIFSGGTGGAAAWAGQLVTGTFASITHGEQAYITVTARISDGLGADTGEVIMNIAEMSHATAPITTSNEVATEVGEPLLVLVKASDPPTSNTVGAGDSITYAVTITNIGEPAGPSPAYDIVFTDTLPGYANDAVPTLLGITVGGAPVDPSLYITNYAGGVFTIFFDPTFAFSLPVGSELVIRYVATVDADVGAGLDLTNTAQVMWSSLPGATPGDRNYGPIADDTTLHTVLPDIVKTVTPITASIGSLITYTIHVPEVPITATLYNAVVTDALAPWLAITAVDAPSNSGQIVQWTSPAALTITYASIPVGEQRTITVTAVVIGIMSAPVAGDVITNVVTLEHDTGITTSEAVTVTVTEPLVTLVKGVEIPHDPLGAGDLVTYTIALSNTGDWPAYDLVITDSLPLGLAYVNEVDFTVTDPATATMGGMYPEWTLSQLNAGGMATIRFTAQVAVDIAAGATLTNAAWGVYDGQPGDNPDEREYDIPTDTVPVNVGYPLLELVKSAAPDPVEAGGLLTYTLTVTNTGIVSATGVVVTDAVPLNTTYLDCGPLPCGGAAGVVSWTLGTLDVNATRVLTMRVQVASPLLTGTLLTNTAWVTSTEGLTDTDTIATPVESAHMLAITKTAEPAVVQAGDLLTYTLAWSVSGNEPALGVTISDTIPANATYWDSDPAATTAPLVGGTGLVTWDLGDQNPPASGMVTLVVRVDTPLLTGTVLFNAALITDTQGITDTDTVDTPVESAHTLALTKTAEPPVVQAGDLLTYTLAWAVSGNEPALSVTISDTLPAHTSFVTATLPHTLTDDLVRWPLGNQDPDASGVVTLVVRVDTPLLTGTMLSNAALITDTQGITDTDTVDTPVESAHTLVLTKTAEPALVQAGDLLTYTLAWSVAGNEPALGVTISDTVPANSVFDSCNGGLTCVESGGLVTWGLGDQNPPASGVVTLVVRVDTPLLTGTVLFNAALITDTQGLTDTDTVDTPVGSAHTLALTKTADPAVVQAGGLLTYTLAWAVAGNQPALGVIISDTVPANTAFDSCSGGLACGESGGLVTWELGDQNPPTSDVVTLVVRVDSDVPTGTLLYNAASITDTQGLTDIGEITTPVETNAEIWVVKTGSASPVTPGEPMTYSLTITSGGPSDAENVVVTDTLPAEVTFGSADPPEASGPNPLVWDLSTLTPGESRDILITVTVNADVTAGFTNTVIITTTTPGDDPGNNQDDHPVDVAPLADVTITKSGSHSPAVAGGPLVYTLVYTNYGPSDAQNVVVADTLPAEVTFVAAMPDRDTGPNPLLWNLGTLAVGDSGQIVITVTVNADVSGTFTNTVVIATDTPESDYDNNDDDEPTDVVSTDEVGILKAVTPFIATIGDIITYTLLFPEPPLGAPLDNVTVTDRFAPWLEIQTIEAPGSAAAVWELYAPNAAITVTYASIPAGEQRLITVTAGVVSDEWEPPWSPVAGDVMTNVATLAYGAVVTMSNEVTTTVVEPELVIVKASDPPQSSTVAPGQAVTYTVTITNVGDSPAYRYDFEDQLPVGMQQITPTLLSVTIDGATVDPSGYYAWIVPGTVFIAFENWTPLPAGSVLQIVYVAYVDDDVVAGVDLTNSVSIDWMSALPDMMPGPRMYPPISDTNTVHVGYPALDLAKSAAPDPVEPGCLLTYTLTVSNTGVFALTGVFITDVIPIHTTFVAATLPHDGPAPDDTPGSVITWTVGALDAGATRIFTLVVAVDSLLLDGTLIANTAWVTSTEGLTDTDTITTAVESWHSLAMTKTADPSPVQAGDLLTYTLAWSVAGNEPALGVTISDTVPANTAFDRCSGGLVCGESGGLVTWELGDQNPPALDVVTLVVRVDSNVPTGTLLYNAASITDTQGLTDTGEITTPVETSAEIWVTKTGSASPVTPGEPMIYSLTITNDGPSDAENVVVTDTLPAEVTFASASPAPTSGPNPLVWNLGTLAAGESRSILITVTVNANVTAGFTNTVIIITTTPGDDPGNNEDDHPVDVTPDVEIWVTKTGSASPVIPGEPMTYSLTITNNGPSDAENVVVTDTLPAEVTFDSASPVPTSGPNPLVWNLGTLPADESRDILVTVTVNSNVTAGFTNTVVVTTTTPGDDPGNNEDDHPVDVVASADLAITKSDSPDPVVPGETLIYTLVYTNYGPSDAANVVVADTLPAEVTFVAADPPQTSGPNPLTWNLGTVAAGDSGQIVITTTVNSDVTAPFTNTVVITSDTSDDNPDNNTDEESTLPLIPGMELVKTVLPGAAVPNMPFTYVIAITNTGYVTLDPLILTDTLPGLDFHYVAGSATPSEPSLIAPPLLVWPDLGPLDPGASISVTFVVTVTPGLTLGTYVNVALATGDHPGGVLTDTDDVPIVIEDPAIALSKHLVDFDTDVWAPNFVTFTIAITNVGLSEIDVLPLYDLYDAAYLHFAYAFLPAPNTVDNVNGQVVWFDLTTPAPHGFGRNLLPGESFTLTTVFTVVREIDTPVTNTAVVSDAIDIYNNPTPDEEDEEIIIDIPTAVDLLYFRAVALNEGIRLEWATAVEIDNFGFTLHRATEPDFTRASEIVFIPSACRGNLCGATYDYLDTAVDPSVVYWYWLVDVDTSGVTTRHGPVSGRVSGAAWPIRIFLPLVLRNH